MTLQIIFGIGLIVLALLIFARWNYRKFNREQVFIESVSCQLDQDRNTIKCLCKVDFNLDKESRSLVLKRVFKKKNKTGADQYIERISALKGKDIRYYYLPLLRNFGFLDDEILLVPKAVYLVILFAYLIPFIAILSIG